MCTHTGCTVLEGRGGTLGGLRLSALGQSHALQSFHDVMWSCASSPGRY